MTSPILRLATREETDTAVIFRFAPVDDPDISTYTVYKTDPPSYKYEPSAKQALQTLTNTWQQLAAQHDDSGITWTNI